VKVVPYTKLSHSSGLNSCPMRSMFPDARPVRLSLLLVAAGPVPLCGQIVFVVAFRMRCTAPLSTSISLGASRSTKSNHAIQRRT